MITAATMFIAYNQRGSADADSALFGDKGESSSLPSCRWYRRWAWNAHAVARNYLALQPDEHKGGSVHDSRFSWPSDLRRQ
jgi:hypothetical protein